jgi:hypothetical protein
MSATVEVIRKGERLKWPVEDIAKRIGALVPGLILERIDAGLDIKDKPFAPYSSNYAAALQLANEDPKVDLRLTGGLMNSVKTRRIIRRADGVVTVVVAPDAGTSPRVRLAPPWVTSNPAAAAAWRKSNPGASRTGKRGPAHNVLGAWIQHGTPTMRARPWLGLSPQDLRDLRRMLGL